MRLIDIDRMPNFEVKTTDGKEYVLLPFKHLYSIPTVNAIPLDRIKQARRELNKLPIYGAKFTDEYRIHLDREEVFSIIDKLIESEE